MEGVKLDDVALLGTGMVRFGTHPDRTLFDLVVEAGLRGLADAQTDLREVGEAYCGSMLAPPMYGVRVMQQLGLTGLAVVTIENASASGLVALREAAFAVQSGRCTEAAPPAATAGFSRSSSSQAMKSA